MGIIKLTCRECRHKWMYKGKKKIYATCPKCRASVRTTKKLCNRCKINMKDILWDQRNCDKCLSVLWIEGREKEREHKRDYQKKYLDGLSREETEKRKSERKIYLRSYIKKRYNTDKSFNIASRLRTLVRLSLKNYTKNGKVVSSKEYGIDYKKIIDSLKPFPKNISKYHIDHIKPCCSFDLEDEAQVKECFSPENLRWLLAEDNLRKIKEDLKIKINRNLRVITNL